MECELSEHMRNRALEIENELFKYAFKFIFSDLLQTMIKNGESMTLSELT